VDDRLQLKQVQELEATLFWDTLKNRFKTLNPKDRNALVYIHGFNVSFEAAALRAGQIGCDLGINGAMAFFSWPSKGKVFRYSADASAIDSSEYYLEQFLTLFASKSGAKKVHVIAHSMGNRGLLRTIERIVYQVEKAKNIKFGQIFLAAPDVSTDLFRKLSHYYRGISDRTTL
jgi:esterase/lipase superfamily enzyme